MRVCVCLCAFVHACMCGIWVCVCVLCVWICVYMCVCMHVHVCICMSMCVYICVWMHVYVCMQVSVCLCVVCMNMCVFMCLYMYVCVCLCVCMCVCLCMCSWENRAFYIQSDSEVTCYMNKPEWDFYFPCFRISQSILWRYSLLHGCKDKVNIPRCLWCPLVNDTKYNYSYCSGLLESCRGREIHAKAMSN